MDDKGFNLPPYELDSHQREALTDLFRIIDRNSDGFIDVEEFARFGRAMTGQIIDHETALYQLRRADADNDDHLSLEDWLLYGRFLARTPDFFAVVAALKRALFALDRREGTAAVGDDLASASLGGASGSAEQASATAAATRAYQNEMHAVRVAADRGIVRKGRAAALDAARVHAEEAAAIGAGADLRSMGREPGGPRAADGPPRRAHIPVSARRRLEEENAARGFTPRGEDGRSTAPASGAGAGGPGQAGRGRGRASGPMVGREASVPRLDLSSAKVPGSPGSYAGKGTGAGAGTGAAATMGSTGGGKSGIGAMGLGSPSGVAAVDFG